MKLAVNKDGSTSETTYAELFIQRVLKDAIEKGAGRDMIMAYMDGHPEQGIDITSNGDSIAAPTDDVMTLVRKVSAELKKKKT